jgi:hypothetical protein
MNIFYLDPNPRTCAEMHNDKHVVKMILEYAQLLSTAHRYLDGTEGKHLSPAGRNIRDWRLGDNRDNILYSATHINHPSAVWARKSSANYDWLYVMWVELMDEYTYRYGRVHASERLKLALSRLPYKIPKGDFTPPTPAMPDEYKVGDVAESYHKYYIGSKRVMSRWTDRPMPKWFFDGINTEYNEDCYVITNKRGQIVSTSTVNM